MRILAATDLRQAIGMDEAVAALDEALRLESGGKAVLPARLNIGLTEGWLRVMPGALFGVGGWGVFGGKVMNLHPRTGVRYLNLLFSLETGELLAIADAAYLTQLRTGAMSALFARYAVRPRPPVVGLLGSGFEARGQLEAIVHAIRPEAVRVFSPRAERRQEFARWASAQFGLPVEAVDTAREAVEGAPVVVLASKSTQPIVRGEWFADGCAVISVGSVRPEQRELDEEAMRRARLFLVDHPEQVERESGDVQAGIAAGALSRDRLVPFARVVGGEVSCRVEGKGLVVFKTSGTALQDLAVTKVAYERCLAAGFGRDLGDWQEVKAPR